MDLITTLKHNTTAENADHLLKTFVETSEIIEKSLKKTDEEGKESSNQEEVNENSTNVYTLSFDE